MTDDSPDPVWAAARRAQIDMRGLAEAPPIGAAAATPAATVELDQYWVGAERRDDGGPAGRVRLHLDTVEVDLTVEQFRHLWQRGTCVLSWIDAHALAWDRRHEADHTADSDPEGET